MTDPRRFIDEDGGGFERELVGAGCDERPAPELRSKLHAALGLGAAAAVATSAVAGATGTAKGSALGGLGAAAGASKVAPVAASVALAKWIGVTVLVGVTAIGATAVLKDRPPAVASAPGSDPGTSIHPTTERAANARSAPAKATPQPGLSVVAPGPAFAPEATRPELQAAVAGGMPVSVAAAASSRRGEPVGSVVSAAPATLHRVLRAPSIAEETAMLDDAKAALRRGDNAGAIQLVDRYDLACEKPTFAPEALVVRIEAYAAKHDRPATVDLCNKFLRLYPDLPQAQRVRSLLESARASIP